MTPFEYARLLQYIFQNNGWANAYDIYERNRYAIKYVDACFDSRDGKVWLIKFRSIVGHNDEVSFRIESEEDIAKIYRFLDEPMRGVENNGNKCND